jgi:hypothetical protein
LPLWPHPLFGCHLTAVGRLARACPLWMLCDGWMLALLASHHRMSVDGSLAWEPHVFNVRRQETSRGPHVTRLAELGTYFCQEKSRCRKIPASSGGPSGEHTSAAITTAMRVRLRPRTLGRFVGRAAGRCERCDVDRGVRNHGGGGSSFPLPALRGEGQGEGRKLAPSSPGR